MDYFIQNITELIKSLYVDERCVKCNNICCAKLFQQNFKNWTSGNNDIDKIIQDTQLLDHSQYARYALEWIPFDRFCNIKCIVKDEFGRVYIANWIDGRINNLDNKNKNWIRKDQNMLVVLKYFDYSKDGILRLIKKITGFYKVYGVSQDSETKNYIMVQDDTCEKCNYICNVTHFQRNFKNWTSGNDDIDRLIHNTQLSSHRNYQISKALEWIPYDRLYDIKWIAKDKVYRANWIDGYINKWDNENQN
ncbi:hypothetical protein RirG_187040 [Rhizophagus irregularis DAOM 197198w]|nr:hypothetical protein RirG_187040 [Rhizophagus irregularis DAOM 197198w]